MASRAIGVILGLSVGSGAIGGNLNPPAGPVAPTPGPEPRIAINSTNTPGDANSVYRISEPGSYYLTGNVIGAAGKSGIEIATSNVSIDLMGYGVNGVTGSLDGVTGFGAGLNNIEVRNGSARSWGGDGIDVLTSSSSARLANLHATGNGGDGIRSGSGSTIVGCVAVLNGGDGIQVGTGCVVTECNALSNAGTGISTSVSASLANCAATSNLLEGIEVGTGSTVTGCAARNNDLVGFLTGETCTLTACTAYANIGSGFSTGSNSTITGCTSGANGADGFDINAASTISGCTATGNTLDGIEVSNDCHVIGNTCDANGGGDGAGIHATSADNRIEGNTCTDADRGIEVDASGSIIIRNTCSGNATNWDIAADNACLVINATLSGAAFTGDAGGASLGSTNAWANFTY